MAPRGSRTEIAVTGRGACSPAGTGVASLWTGLCEKTANMREIEHFETSGATLNRAGFLDGPAEHPEAPDRALELASRAGSEAVGEAGLTGVHELALVLGTTEPGEPGAPSADTARYFPGLLASRCGARVGGIDESITVASASASGAVSIALGRDLLLAGDAAAVLAGGADAIVDTAFLGLNSLRTLGPSGCRPFSRQRRGIGVSEGAGMMVLEPVDVARQRGAPVRAVLAGAAVTNATGHLATPGSAGVRIAVEQALEDAGVAPGEVDLINAHGPGTRQGDRVEIEALREVFGAELAQVPIVSSKSVLWHLQGAAGAVEALACVLCLGHGAITPTRIVDELDPSCADLDLVAEPAARPAPGLRTALSISCGLGGLNAALVFKKE